MDIIHLFSWSHRSWQAHNVRGQEIYEHMLRNVKGGEERKPACFNGWHYFNPRNVAGAACLNDVKNHAAAPSRQTERERRESKGRTRRDTSVSAEASCSCCVSSEKLWSLQLLQTCAASSLDVETPPAPEVLKMQTEKLKDVSNNEQ